jgi:SAM-dependent methyltransferase
VASTVRFPYDDASFDFVFATSVFTHLLPDAGARYLVESRRVLRPGGRLFATWFLLDEDAPPTEAALELFPFDERTHRVASRKVPEAVIGFPRQAVTRAYASAGLHLSSLTAGHWAQGLHELPYQDMLVGRRL